MNPVWLAKVHLKTGFPLRKKGSVGCLHFLQFIKHLEEPFFHSELEFQQCSHLVVFFFILLQMKYEKSLMMKLIIPYY